MLSFRRSADEDGVVLITVLLVTFVLLILVAGTMAYAIGSQPLSRRDQDWNAALSSAEAGLDDYLYRLNQNDQYYLYGAAPTPPLACGTGLTLAAPPDGNLAFSQWLSVPGATSNATFTYRVDTSCLSQGAVIVWSTGKAANVTRTVQATLRRRAFIDYLYFTDYETLGPRRLHRQSVHAGAGAGELPAPLLRLAAAQLELHRHQLRFRRHDQRPVALQRRDLDMWDPGVQRQGHDQLAGCRQPAQTVARQHQRRLRRKPHVRQ